MVRSNFRPAGAVQVDSPASAGGFGRWIPLGGVPGLEEVRLAPPTRSRAPTLSAGRGRTDRCRLELLPPTYGPVTGPCFARVRRFRWRVFLVRQFPSSLSNNACGLRSSSVAPFGRCPLIFLSKYCTDVIRSARDLISKLNHLDTSRSPRCSLSIVSPNGFLSLTSGSANPLRSTFYTCQPTRSHRCFYIQNTLRTDSTTSRNGRWVASRGHPASTRSSMLFNKSVTQRSRKCGAS